MSNVTVSLGYTKNLGNFESLRLDVGFEDSVRDGESSDEAFRRVYDDVERQLISKLNELNEEVEETRGG